MFHIESIKREIAASQSTYFVVDRSDLESLVVEVERLHKEDQENINKISELESRIDQLVEENITLRNTSVARPAATVKNLKKDDLDWYADKMFELQEEIIKLRERLEYSEQTIETLDSALQSYEDSFREMYNDA